MFDTCPPASFEFKAFWAQNRSLVRVRRTCVLLTSVFYQLDLGPWRTRPQKSGLLYHFSRSYFGSDYNHSLKNKNVHSDWAFEFLAAVLYCFQNLLQNPSESQRCVPNVVCLAHFLDSKSFPTSNKQKLLAGTCVQSVRAEYFLTAVL